MTRVGTADSWNKFQDGTADPLLSGQCDGVKPVTGVKFLYGHLSSHGQSLLTCQRLVNAFGYWQGQNINNATATYLDDLQQAIGQIQKSAGLNTVEIWNGETGWPANRKYSIALINLLLGIMAIAYWSQRDPTTAPLKPALQTRNISSRLASVQRSPGGVNVFYFEAFDETWKPMSTGDNKAQADETHWGAFDENRVAKFDLTC